MFEMKADVDFIKHCDILAEGAASKGESPVGALITKNGEIVCEAIEASKNKNDVSCHAELEAMRLAVKKIKNKQFVWLRYLFNTRALHHVFLCHQVL